MGNVTLAQPDVFTADTFREIIRAGVIQTAADYFPAMRLSEIVVEMGRASSQDEIAFCTINCDFRGLGFTLRFHGDKARLLANLFTTAAPESDDKRIKTARGCALQFSHRVCATVREEFAPETT